MFVLINLVGLGLSLGITLTVGVVLLNSSHLAPLMGMYRALTGHLAVPKQLVYSLGEVAATPICAVWNFSANKLWTFRGHHS
jgi:hypothetical protein